LTHIKVRGPILKCSKGVSAPLRQIFVWDDPLLLEQQLSEDERMVRDAARAYCQKKLADMQTEIAAFT
jgi:hypothetical protein